MFMGRNNNNNNGVNVNSSLYVSYSEACMLKVGAWNQNLSLRFHPMKGVNADGIRQYAQDNTEIISTSLTVDNTSALLEGIKKEITPAIEEKRAGNVSIAMGSNDNRKVLTLSTDGNDITLTISIGVNEQGIASDSLTHKFNKKEYMVGYDPSTGSGEIVMANADYDNFVEKLKDIYKLSAAVAHSINYNNALKSSFGNRQANNANSNHITDNSYSAPAVTATDMSDFLQFS